MSDIRAVSFWPCHYDSALDTMSAREVPDPPMIPAIDTRKPWEGPALYIEDAAAVYDLIIWAEAGRR